MQLQTFEDLRVAQIKERRGINAGLTIGGAISLVVGLVIYFAMMYVSTFVSATVKNAIPQDGYDNATNASIAEMDTNRHKTFKVLGILPIFFVIVGLLSVIMGLAN